MTTPFAARDAVLSGAVDRTFGEQFTFTAMMVPASGDVNLPRVVDPAKPAFTCVGVWEALSQAEFTQARGSNPDDESLRRSMQYPSVSVDNSLLTWMPTSKCLCRRLFNSALYEVVRAMPDDMGRTLFVLTSKQ
jgi:hypothetical protein